MADMNELVVFIPVSDTETYFDWDSHFGYSGFDQIDVGDGIIVGKCREEEFRKNVADFEKWNK